jgi:hypothetical protein
MEYYFSEISLIFSSTKDAVKHKCYNYSGIMPSSAGM